MVWFRPMVRFGPKFGVLATFTALANRLPATLAIFNPLALICAIPLSVTVELLSDVSLEPSTTMFSALAPITRMGAVVLKLASDVVEELLLRLSLQMMQPGRSENRVNSELELPKLLENELDD